MAREPTDFLEQFRRKSRDGAPARPAEAASLPSGELKPYEVFRVAARPAALALYPALGAAHSTTYSYLFNVSWDDEIFETVVLFFTFMQVNVRGRNLSPVVDGLRLRKCECLRQFHEKEHLPPAAGEPIIASIEIVVKDLPSALAESAVDGR